MKKIFYILAIFGLLAISCSKDDSISKEDMQPTVSISADDKFNDENIAKLTVSISSQSEEDVIVILANADVQSGKTKAPIFFDKKVTIPAGKTKSIIDIEVDILGLEAGDYQAALKIESADGAKKDGAKDIVYINYIYAFKPVVNLYSDTPFASDQTATIKVVLSKSSTQPIIVTLETDSESKLEMEYEKKVTIPAGETQAEIVVTVEIPEDIVPGVYPGILKITSVENGLVGNVSSVTINLSYPFASTIIIDGEFDDWEDSNVSSWTLPEGETMYNSIKNLKLTADEKYVFVYIELYDPGYDVNMPFNMYIDADGNPETGAFVGSIDNDTFYPPYEEENMGLEYYIELSLHDADKYNDFYSWGGIYKYEGVDGEGVFSGLNNLSGTYDGSVIYAAGNIDNENIGRIEIQLQRSWFGMKGDKARFAIKNMDGVNNWAAIGLLPQGEVIDGVRQHVDMATIYLPPYEE